MRPRKSSTRSGLQHEDHDGVAETWSVNDPQRCPPQAVLPQCHFVVQFHVRQITWASSLKCLLRRVGFSQAASQAHESRLVGEAPHVFNTRANGFNFHTALDSWIFDHEEDTCEQHAQIYLRAACARARSGQGETVLRWHALNQFMHGKREEQTPNTFRCGPRPDPFLDGTKAQVKMASLSATRSPPFRATPC